MSKPEGLMRHRALKIAYEVTQAASYIGRTDRVTGINRVIGELLKALIKTEEVDIDIVGLHGSDSSPVRTSTKANVYREINFAKECRETRTFKSRTGFGLLYEKRMKRILRQHAEMENRCAHLNTWAGRTAVQKCGSFPNLVRRQARRLVSSFLDYDVKQHLPASYDIFHSTYFALPPKAVTKGVARLLTVHDLIPLTFKETCSNELVSFFKEIITSLDVRNDWAICVSEFTKRELCQWTGISPERVFVAPLAAADCFKPVTEVRRISDCRRKYEIPEGDYLLSLCTPQPRKNLAHLVRSFGQLVKKQLGHRINLVLAGTRTRETEELIAQASKEADWASHQGHVHMTGYIGDEDLSSLYSGATAFVFPSLYEGFGLPPLEAMSCGVPVICSNTTSLPEVVGSGAILIDPRNGEELADAMFRVITTPALAADLRQRSVERARQFSWKRCASRTLEAYRAIVDSQKC